MSTFDKILPIRRIMQRVGDAWVAMAYRKDLAIEGTGVTLEDDGERIVATITAGGADLSDDAAAAVSTTGSAGVSVDVSRADHVHAHGNLTGGSLHAVATGGAAGFMSASDKTKLDGVATGATALSLASAAPETVGTANAAGVGATAARVDHVHAHGAQTIGTLHAVATSSTAGFMSAADRVKIDPPEVTPFNGDLDFASSYWMTYDGDGTAACVLGLETGAAHVAGSEIVVYVPATQATDVRGAPALGAAGWEPHDPTKPYVVRMLYTEEGVVSSGSVVEPPVAAPTIVSATIYAEDPDVLVVVWSAPVHWHDATGLSLTGTSETISNTLVAAADSNGTTTLHLDLSGNVAGTETISLTVGASRTVHALDGPLVATETEAVVLDGFVHALPGLRHRWRADDVTTSGANLATINDTSGGAYAATLDTVAGSITATTIGGAEAWDFGAENSGRYIYGTFDNLELTTEALTSGAVAMVFQLSDATPTEGMVPFAMGQASSETTAEVMVFAYTTGPTLYGRRTNAGTGDVTTTPSASAVSLLLTWDGDQAELYINGTQVDTDATTVAVANVKRFIIGAQPNLTDFDGGLIWAETQVGNQHITGADVDAWFAYTQTRYGVG